MSFPKLTNKFTANQKHELLEFNGDYQLQALRYFAGLKRQWRRDHPGKQFPGLCAEVDSITGKFRPLEAQRAWSWGDARALGIWSYFLQKGRIPDAEEKIVQQNGQTIAVNLKRFYEEYCDQLYALLVRRFHEGNGKIPFLIDLETGKPSDDPRNLHPQENEFISTHVFAINAFFQHGLRRDNQEALQLGWRTLTESCHAAHENRFIDHLSRKRQYAHTHGPAMISTGAAVDTLKTIRVMEARGDNRFGPMKERLVAAARWAVDMTLGYHWRARSKQFSEFLDPVTKEFYVNDKGQVICDPGHTAEAIGFYAELLEFLPVTDNTNYRFNRSNMLPVLADMALFVHEHGYSEQGVMFKHIDALTGNGVADAVIGGEPYRTAPWWNVRELCAATMKLYQLTADERMWQAYVKAFNATYANYPNPALNGLMRQTLDADTLLPLPYHPATGNLDPMHSPRAREREIEALEAIDCG